MVASTFIVIPLMNLIDVPVLELLPISLVAALGAPIFTLILATVAGNKVQGFAVMKGWASSFWRPFRSGSFPSRGSGSSASSPPYWPVKAFLGHVGRRQLVGVRGAGAAGEPGVAGRAAPPFQQGGLSMTHNPFTTFIQAHGVVILDGAMATELERRGADIADPLWSAKVLLEAPELIRQVHYDYFAAGADVAITAAIEPASPGLPHGASRVTRRPRSCAPV
ncbi:MAG: homocysteine S-methyltransferase family protein [Caldilineaceae bacterium]